MWISSPPTWAATNRSVRTGLTFGIFATRIVYLAWVKTLIPNASPIVRTVRVMFTFSSFNYKKIVMITSIPTFTILSSSYLTWNTETVWVSSCSRGTLASCIVIINSALSSGAAWTVIRTRIDTSSIATCLSEATLIIRRTSHFNGSS
jgi:hypothetical protein